MRAYNSTIQRKKKRCSDCGQMEFIFSHGRCAQCAKVDSANKTGLKESNEEESESVAILKKDADLLFSRLVRLRAAAAETGLLECYVCSSVVHYSQAHAMHFVGREDSAVRLHPKNVRAGCFTCNVTKGGNLDKYREKLELEEHRLPEWLEAEGREPYKFWREELKRMIADFSREITHLKRLKQLK